MSYASGAEGKPSNESEAKGETVAPVRLKGICFHFSLLFPDFLGFSTAL
jgi:hypothetical protein